VDTHDAIDAYAWAMLRGGMAHAVQEDLNEDGALDDGEWRAAVTRARDLFWAIGLLAEEIGVAASMRQYWEESEDAAARRAVVLAAFGEPIPVGDPESAGDPRP
jgi:hypothetical protein